MKTNAKLYYLIFLVVGILMLVNLLIDLYVDYLPEYLKGFFLSGGVVFTLVSSIYLSNKSFIKKADLAGNDERIKMIRSRSCEISFVIVSIIALTICIVLGCFGGKYMPYVSTISTLIIAYTLVQVIVRTILSKKL